MKTLRGRSFSIILPALLLATPASGQTNDVDLPVLLTHVRERITQAFIDLQKVACTDKFRQEALDGDRKPREKPHESIYDMIIRLQPATPDDTEGQPFYLREDRDV